MAYDLAKLREVAETLEGLDRRKTYRRLDFFKPYPKQQEFIDLGLIKRERLLIAANRVGKSEVGAFETACHLTGIYPDWWLGREFHAPTRGWAAGESTTLVRDVQQRKLCGDPGVEEAFGTGMIPRDLFVGKPSTARGATDAYDTIHVRHKSGGVSVLRFKSYEQGRAKFQGDDLDFGWCDEEPPPDVYSEFMTRLAPTPKNPLGGIMYLTFTPLLGRSEVVLKFLDEQLPDCAWVNMTIEDAEHISPEQRQKIVNSYRKHEREARAKGVPILGSGRIYETAEDAISEPALEHIPAYWVKLWGLDFGNNFGAVLILWDKDNDVIHVHEALPILDSDSLHHAAAIQRVGAAVPVAWPHDGTQLRHDRGFGEAVHATYKGHGLVMLPDHATWPDGGYSVEAGIAEIDEREKSGRLKVARHLTPWFEERRFYHRKDGQIVKVKDHLMDATRTAVMMKRFARAVGLGNRKSGRKRPAFATGIDFDLFG